jgi:hypothetical protein
LKDKNNTIRTLPGLNNKETQGSLYSTLLELDTFLLQIIFRGDSSGAGSHKGAKSTG